MSLRDRLSNSVVKGLPDPYGKLPVLGLLACLGLACGGLAPRSTPRPPNIVLVVVDTLRWDHLGTYGYGRPTSPEIDRLAARGLVFEDAYAQAPWTLPSVASLLTGHPPAALANAAGEPAGIPQGVATLAERLAASGYRTAAFIANPTLHAGIGFDRGFETFYSAPYDLSSFDLHADALNRQVLPWLREHGAGGETPFFLYVHYLDPHDPYANPEIAGGSSPLLGDYGGGIDGRDVHGLYLGRRQLADPVADLEHLVALYDSEIRYVDRHLGALLRALPEEAKRESLIVLTSDHGEELLDHGGWKHGDTLYEEQIHVPLIVRWDGRIEAGRRVQGTVRLLDLVPTLLAAADRPDDALVGANLLPVLEGRAAPPRRPAFARTLSGAPSQAAVVLGGRKLVLFDRQAAYAPPADRADLWHRNQDRLGRLAGFDLRSDAGELRPSEDMAGPTGEPLGRWLARDLDRWRRGIRVLASQLPAGSVLTGSLRLDPPGQVRPVFLGAMDQVVVEGAEVRFRWLGDAMPEKGLLIAGDVRQVEIVELVHDGRPLATVWPLGKGAGDVLRFEDVDTDRYPPLGDGPSLRIWHKPSESAATAEPLDEESIRRLRALGYAF